MTFNKPLLLAFEIGYSALPGVKALPMHSWNDARRALRELRKPAVREAFETIVIDTLDLAYGMVEKYICAKNEVEHITDGKLTYGKGADLAYQELNEFIISLTRLGYGVVMISHATDKTFREEGMPEYTKKAPTLSKKPYSIFAGAADILGFVSQVNTGEYDSDGMPIKKSVLITRDNPRCVAGTRFKEFPTYVDLNYTALVNAIAKSVDSMAKEFTTDKPVVHQGPDLEALKEEFEEIKNALLAKEGQPAVPKIVATIRNHCGEKATVATLTEDQAQSLQFVVNELKEML